ncbi:MAG: hypothetical protein CME06_08945 [Gemmatimonadetes bacterium]|nr:hypothetical protein [Gemmatimonadota bacterium]
MIAGLTLLVAAAAALLLPRSFAGLDRPTRWTVAAARTVAAFALLIVAWDPTLRWREVQEEPIALVALIDRSGSMSIADPMPRAEIADRVLDSLRAAEGTRVWRVEEIGDSTGTDLAGALSRLDLTGEVKGVVLISDGANSATESPERAAAALGKPVHTVSIGSPLGPVDSRISGLRCPDPVPWNSAFAARLTISSRDARRETIVAKFYWGDSLLATTSLPPGSNSEEVAIELPPLPEGTQVLRAEIPVQPGELIASNNTWNEAVRVSSAPMPVLVLAGAPSPDVATSLRALRSDPGLDVRSVVRIDERSALREGFDHRSNALPSRSDLDGIEVVLFAGAPPIEPEGIAHLVAELGVGLIVWDASHRYPLGRFSDRLPLAPGPPATKSRALSTPPARLDHEALGGGSISAAAWRELPPASSASIASLRSGELLIGLHDDPLLAVGNWGRGRVASLALEGTWRWELASSRTGRSTARVFWTSLARWASGRARTKKFSVAPIRTLLSPGDSLRFDAAETSKSTDDASRMVRVTGANQEIVARIPLTRTAQGRYVGRAAGLPPGPYDYTALVDSSPADSGSFVVARLDREMQETRARLDMMRNIAVAAGGIDVRPDALDSLISSLPTGLEQRTITRRARPGRSRFMLVLVAASLGLELWLRRRSGLL